MPLTISRFQRAPSVSSWDADVLHIQRPKKCHFKEKKNNKLFEGYFLNIFYIKIIFFKKLFLIQT